jgi:hypothetical protein
LRRPLIRGARALQPAVTLATLALLVGALLVVFATGLPGPAGTPGAVGQTSAGEVTPQTDDAVPARGMVLIGASPSEAPNETWGIGEVGGFNSGAWALVRYADGDGWSRAPWLDSSAQQPSGAVLKPAGTPLAGRATSSGAVALLATVAEEGRPGREVLLARAPGGSFREAAAVPGEGEAALLKPGERLFGHTRAPLLAALDEGSARAGALVVPVNGEGSAAEEDGVLHWDGSAWTREQIDVPAVSREHGDFRVLAIGASSPANAWLLAQLSQQADPGAVALFRRHLAPSAPPIWQPVAPAAGAQPGARLTAGEQPFSVAGLGEPPTAAAQILTVTDEGVWIDGERPDAPLTMFFKSEGEEPGGEGYRGRVLATWCNASAGSPPCTYTLPDSLPAGPSRSFAWSDPSNPLGFGQRVITGLGEGVSLRLEGGSFVRVLALGADEQSFLDVGGSRGAAFSNAREGWLGNERMPVHLTQHPAANRLTPYPVPFSHPLLALAPQPGGPVGALSSQALAVGDRGEVARFTPGQGWQPESLLGAGGRRATPRLRAVAWPSANRAYAVGDGEVAQMWLWRGETGLWEPDPAAPRNFRGRLLGIAFDPSNPTRGYAVGRAGVLLRFGKSWSQEALPGEVAGATFTSIAFAGSQAIVAFRVPHQQGGGEGAHYTGGLLVNDGAGWHVDQAAASTLEGGLPWAVAGLPDGGAALSGQRGAEPVVLERESPGAPWHATTVPYPGGEAPGSLSLFREAGALRVIGSGGIPNTSSVDFSETPPPSTFPENLVKAYPLAGGYVLRETPVGWSDEEHDRDEVGSPAGEPKQYDLPYRPDPTSAVLIDPSGTRGWAVGGQIDPRLETADVARYPADGVPPPGFAAAPVAVSPAQATFAIGGGAQCAAACADRAAARIGPDAWLASAIGQAGQIAGVRAFLYTGPRVTNGEGRIHPAPVPRERELARYAELMRSGSLPAFAGASPTDRAGIAGECLFVQAFAGFPAPFGTAPAASGLLSAGGSGESCTSGSSSYYALDSSGSGGPVRVIVLDDSSDVSAEQRAWVGGELVGARQAKEPAIVVGNADLSAQISAGDGDAAALAQTLVSSPSASAYFYDSSQRNVSVPLRVGSNSIPAFGSGTLGYMNSRTAQKQDFTGHAGFLLAQVETARRDPASNRAPVTARLIPNIGELALEAKDGVLLRRSQQSLFDGLARRPRAGCLATGTATNCETSPYIPIPANCVGSVCGTGIFPEYTFSSSRPDIGDFVAPNLASPDPRAVLLGPNDKPIPDPTSSLFCAYNAGTTVATISAGGLSASLTITVQAGSVRRPCGTQPLKELPAQSQASSVAPAPPPAPAPAPTGPAPAPTPTPVPVAPSPIVSSPAPGHPAATPKPPYFLPPAAAAPLLAFLPLPVPTPGRPTPPSGTSPVTSPVEAPEREEEEEEATESVGNNAASYSPADHEPSPAYVLGVVVLAAFAGASVRRRPRRGRGAVRVAPATISATRTQRRNAADRSRHR